MQIARVTIKNFRGIADATLYFDGHTVLIGDNNSCKSTVLEAIDLVLGPERLSRAAPIDEHDFYAGQYLDENGAPVPIEVEVMVTNLTTEQQRRFRDNLEFWDELIGDVIDTPPPEAIEGAGVKEALRIGFRGWYEPEDDDFKAETFFVHPVKENGEHDPFRTADKRMCGFLFLRALRTGSRALSLERGSLLDIILRVRELRPKMWEQVLKQLRECPVADDPSQGIGEVLTGVQSAIREFVPQDWAVDPHLRVSDLTREHLRRTLTVFMATGAKNGDVPHAAPFQHQGTGTINMLVLALLSMIAEAKQTVIFAMEEPEIAIPPHTQKRIVDGVRSKSSQVLFTSHSPFVLEEFPPDSIKILERNSTGTLTGKAVIFPSHIKPKAYSSEYRLRFAEALLARRVMIAEGETEMLAYPAAARRLAELQPDKYTSLEAMGIAVFNARTDSQIANYGNFLRNFGKIVFAVYDKQTDATQKTAIEAAVHYPFEAPAKGFEDLLLNETGEAALRRFADGLVSSGSWPSHLSGSKPAAATPLVDLKAALSDYLRWGKGEGNASDLIAECTLDEMSITLKTALGAIKEIVDPPAPPPPTAAALAQPSLIAV